MGIRILDEATASRIAAGEVVERPASVIKELVENSLDAGATSITIEIRDGGTTYLRVTDNGCGIPPEEARLAFANHATSKIHSGDALTDIQTLGFRGEALASVAAVARVTMTTRVRGAESGIRLSIEGGQFKKNHGYRLSGRNYTGSGGSVFQHSGPACFSEETGDRDRCYIRYGRKTYSGQSGCIDSAHKRWSDCLSQLR